MFRITFPENDPLDESFAMKFSHFLVLAAPVLRAHVLYQCDHGTYLFCWLKPHCLSVSVIVRFLAIAFIERLWLPMQYPVAQLIDRRVEEATEGPENMTDQELFLRRLEFEPND